MCKQLEKHFFYAYVGNLYYKTIMQANLEKLCAKTSRLQNVSKAIETVKGEDIVKHFMDPVFIILTRFFLNI